MEDRPRRDARGNGSAVQALMPAQPPHEQSGGRYQAWCLCCGPAADGHPGKPQRREVGRPVMAWRKRLAVREPQQSSCEGSENWSQICL